MPPRTNFPKGRRLCYSVVASWTFNGTMVTLRLLGNLTAANGERALEWELKEQTSLRQLLLAHQEEIPDVIRLWKETECMFTVGVKSAAEATVVKDGDMVEVTFDNSQLSSPDFPIGTGGTVDAVRKGSSRVLGAFLLASLACRGFSIR